MRLHRIFLPLGLIVLAAVVAACGGATALPPTSPPPTQTPLPPPSTTPVTPTVPPPTNTPPPTITPLPPTETPPAELPPTRIQFATGATSALVQGTVQPGGINRYVLKASAGQIMRVYLSPNQQADLLMAISGADGDVLLSGHVKADYWSGVLRTTQDYFISVTTADGSSAVSYTLQVIIPERIQFAAGATSALVSGGAPAGGAHNYVLNAMGGQTMTVRLGVTQGLGLLVIWGADGNVLISDHAGATEWSGVLPSTQDYYIDVQAAADQPALVYTLEVAIPARIQFASGATSAVVSGSAPPGGGVSYVLNAAAGQTMTVRLGVTQGLGLIIIWGADGNVLISDHAGATEWSGVLPTTQDYFIDVRAAADQPALKYTLEVAIPARIQFAPGAIKAEVSGTVPAGGTVSYILGALAGQTMTVDLTFSQGLGLIVIWGADGNVLISDHAGATEWSGVLPTTQDYYIEVHAAADNPALKYKLEVTIPPLP